MHYNFLTAVRVGFEMSSYSSPEDAGTLSIRIVRKDSLISTRDFNISLNLSVSSTATSGKYIHNATLNKISSPCTLFTMTRVFKTFHKKFHS